MPLYRKREPVEARQLTPATRQEIKDWLGNDAWFYTSNGESELYVTHNSTYSVECAVENDWIIEEAPGNFAILKPAAFLSIYEPDTYGV